jgi:8-oxo-dGTP diphosphatase
MKNINVIFYDIEQKSDLVRYTNIVCIYQWKWLLVRWKWKTTWELPWWHIEEWETSLYAAKRELYEETWINWVELKFLCSRKLDIFKKSSTYYGNVYIAKILELWQLPEFEIEEVKLFEEIPENLTYPFIQIDILNKAKEFLILK